MVDLIYLHTWISGVFLFWVLNFENLYFVGTGQSCCIFFRGFQTNAVFLSVLHFRLYFLGPDLLHVYIHTYIHIDINIYTGPTQPN